MWLPSGDPLNPQIGASDLGALQKLEPRTRENDPPALQHIGAIRDAQGLLDILLNQQHRNAQQALRIADRAYRSEEHTSELQSRSDLVCRLLLEKKKNSTNATTCIRRSFPPV